MRLDLLSVQARERLGEGPDWEAFKFECLPHEGPTQVVKLTGAVAPLKDPLLGGTERDWKKKDRRTVADVYITPAEHEAWLPSWELRTGKCGECAGKGQISIGWNHQTGTRRKTCARCAGSGSRPAAQTEAPAC